jgi:hypothetical protein
MIPINWQAYSGRHSYKSGVRAFEYDLSIYVFRFTDQFAHIKFLGSFLTRRSLQSRRGQASDVPTLIHWPSSLRQASIV